MNVLSKDVDVDDLRPELYMVVEGELQINPDYVEPIDLNQAYQELKLKYELLASLMDEILLRGGLQ